MILLHEFDPFFHPLDDDPMIVIESMDFPNSLSRAFSLHDVFSPPHVSLEEVSSYDLVSSEDDHLYLPILK